jgi:hypothetical protein
MVETLNSLFRKLILWNELDGNENAALRFSNASSKSGLSFGVSQLDITHNDNAVACLRECGFNQREILSLQVKEEGWRSCSKRLVDHANIIAKYDEAQLKHCLDKSLDFALSHGVPMADTRAVLAAADYVNQYGSEGEGILAYFKSLGKPFTAEDILYFKLHNTKYGRENPDDCQRRYDNISKVAQQN